MPVSPLVAVQFHSSEEYVKAKSVSIGNGCPTSTVDLNSLEEAQLIEADAAFVRFGVATSKRILARSSEMVIFSSAATVVFFGRFPCADNVLNDLSLYIEPLNLILAVLIEELMFAYHKKFKDYVDEIISVIIPEGYLETTVGFETAINEIVKMNKAAE